MTYLQEHQAGLEPLAVRVKTRNAERAPRVVEDTTLGALTPITPTQVFENLAVHNRDTETPIPKTSGKTRRARLREAQRQAKIDWMREDSRAYQSNYLKKLCLGSLPWRVAKYGCAGFDLEEPREYCGDDGAAVSGKLLAGIAAYIVRCARDPIDYMCSLRNVPAKMIEPINGYLRVKLALGRLEAEIAAVQSLLSEPCAYEAPQEAKRICEISREQGHAQLAGPSKENKYSPKFTWDRSPAKTYGFKDMAKKCGYDPRDTSVYWIEKRAGTLRRKWKVYGQEQRGEAGVKAPARAGMTKPISEPTLQPSFEPPIVKYFEPAEADYNSVWPPVALPSGPPKADRKENHEALAGAPTAQTIAVFMLCLSAGFDFAAVEGRADLGHTAPMSLLTTILTAGARLFGPPPRVDEDGKPGQIEPAGVTAALIALGAKMAKSDGVVTVDEIEAFRRVFQASPANDAAIGRFFDLARQTTLGFERYASIVAKKFRAQPAALEDVLDGLFHIALADGVVTDDELAFLRRVAEIFGFSDHEFKRIQVAHMGRASDDPYLILGIEESVTDSELKRAYRRMAAANHPDRLMSRGLPQELIGLANHKMSMINKAYDEIKKQRKSILPKLHGPAS